MTAAWRLDLPASPKLVLLAMCDWANDEGASLHPSVKAVAIRASMSERNAKRVLHTLIEAGWLSVVGNSLGGKPGMTRQYQLNAAAIMRGALTPTGDNLSRVTNQAGTGDTTGNERVTNGAETGDTGVTQTTIDPSVEPPKKSKRASAPSAHAVDLDFSSWPASPSPQVLGDWLHLRRTRRAAVTPTVLESFGRELHLAAAMGFTVDQCLAKCCTRNWQGFEAAWLERDLPNTTRTSGAAHGSHRESAAERVMRHATEGEREEQQRRFNQGRRGTGQAGAVIDGDAHVVGSDG